MTTLTFSRRANPWGDPSLHLPLSSRLLTTAQENFENFEYPWNVDTNTVILLLGASVSLHVVQVLFSIKQLLNKSITTPRLESYEWLEVWDSMDKHRGRWAPPVVWNFTLEQVQNPEKLVEHLEEVCCRPNNSRETEMTATCWGLAPAYRGLCNTIACRQGEEEVSGSDNKATGAAATSTPGTGTATALTAATGAAAGPETQPCQCQLLLYIRRNIKKNHFSW